MRSGEGVLARSRKVICLISDVQDPPVRHPSARCPNSNLPRNDLYLNSLLVAMDESGQNTEKVKI